MAHLRRILLACTLGWAFLASGCLIEETVTLFPNGAGTIHIRQTLTKDEASSLVSDADTDEKKKENETDSLASSMAAYEGVIAWTDVRTEMTKDGLVLEATGYFSDVNHLKQVDKANITTFRWTKNEDGTFTAERIYEQGKSAKQPLDGDPQARETAEGLANWVKDLQVIFEIRMPGTVKAAEGSTEKSDRSASKTVTGEEFSKFFMEFWDVENECRKKVSDGSMSKDEGNRRLEQFSNEGARKWGNLKVTSDAGDTGEEFAKFNEAFEAAKKSYSGSALEKAVNDKRAAGPK